MARSVADDRKHKGPLMPAPAIAEIAALAPASLAERLDALAKHLKLAYSPNTVRAWRASWRVWTAFCRTRRVPALPTSVPILEDFLRGRIAAGKKRATLEQNLATLATVHRLAQIPNPMDSLEGQLMWRGLRRGAKLKKAQRQVKGLSWVDVETIVEPLRRTVDDPAALRDAALILVGYETLLRRSELVALELNDVDVQPDGTGLVAVERSKTDQEGEGAFRPLSADTVRALKAWIEVAGITEGALWRSVPAIGAAFVNPLDAGDVARIYKRRAGRAGFDEVAIASIAGHSTRVGAAEDLIEANFGTPAIMLAGGWKSERMVVKYGRKIAASRNAMAQLQRSRGR